MPQDLPSTRLDNAMRLFDEFVAATIKHPDAATLRGLERRFAERLGIQPSYWSQIKSRARQIGERLARQFELACHKPRGWMDEGHGAVTTTHTSTPSSPVLPTTAPPGAGPRDDDERFLVELVLSYYRRHPQRARARLLELIGEALAPAPAPAAGPAPGAPGTVRVDDDLALWARSKQGVAPLKPRR